MDKDIVKTNILIEACYRPASLYQIRLLMAVLCQIKSAGTLSHKQEFTITARGLAELIGNTLRTNYRILVRAADELMDMVITVPYRPNSNHQKQQEKKLTDRQHIEQNARARATWGQAIERLTG